MRDSVFSAIGAVVFMLNGIVWYTRGFLQEKGYPAKFLRKAISPDISMLRALIKSTASPEDRERAQFLLIVMTNFYLIFAVCILILFLVGFLCQ